MGNTESAARIEQLNIEESKHIKFLLQNEEHLVNTSEVTPETTLNQYLRENAHLTGTKNMCFEGGCGSCTVVMTMKNPVTGKEVTFSVNSCLVSIFSCHGCKILTVEGIGNPINGFHKIQKTLAEFNGTQCGFCSSGMVMNMYGLSENEKLTMKEVENSFGGNICRCTGYRPILSAFKSLCKDASPELLGTIPDIEDVNVCPKTKQECKGSCVELSVKPFYFRVKESKWIKLFTINDLLDLFISFPTSNFMLVGGNTARGVYRQKITPDIYVDVSSVKELKEHKIEDNSLIIGAGTTLTEAIDLFNKISEENKNFSYLKLLADHINLIANIQVRNIGTLAGNLMIKHEHNEFPSDIFLILVTVAARLTIADFEKKETVKTMEEFLKDNMKRKVIKNVILPAYNDAFKYDSYKIMIRAQNAHALVNAGFMLEIQNNQVKSARILYGCINATFIHASNTEKYLIGKNIFNNTILQEAFKILNDELKPDHILPECTPQFRKGLAVALFYKYVLSIAPNELISPRNRSGREKLKRPISYGTQDFETHKSLYPLTKPIPKIEALAQTSGQAEYIFDKPYLPQELFAAFVLAKAPANTKITKVDPSEALKLDGIVAYYDKNDIPGKNNFMASSIFNIEEEIFCSGTIKYYFQPVGLIVAKSEQLAQKGADIVKISYAASNIKPLLTIRDILKANATDKIKQVQAIIPTTKGNDVKHVIKGTFDIGWQYHYQMETQICLIIPTEDGFDMYPSTQWMDLTQNAAAEALNLPVNKFNVSVRRLGGAYGSKISRNALISTAATIAAHKLNKPIRFHMPMETNMKVIGKRFPCSCDYEVGVDNNGIVQYMKVQHYSDYGRGGNEDVMNELVDLFSHNYNNETWDCLFHTTFSDNHPGTWCRAPGSCEGLAMIESIMEHISLKTNIDPLQLRINNLKKNNTKIKDFIDEFKSWAEIGKRETDIKKFNEENRWIKKGLSVVPMTYSFNIFGNYSVIVSIYHQDGTVSVAHGGIEMGQGINTKAAQVCAYKLGIPLDKVSVKPSNNLIAPNSQNTGGSITSEAVCYGITQACDEIMKRMAPYKENNQTWEQLVAKSFKNDVDLKATAMYSKKSPNIQNYNIYGVCATEVQVDILTGQHIITRVDLLEDTGESMSPLIDIGQVEGAYVMGQGYFTTEELVFDEHGKLLTNRTWNYKPPGAKDIPVDFRVKFPKNNPNPAGVLKSKAVAEPPLCLSCSLPLAIRRAVASARREADSTKEMWYPFDGPSTVENTFLNSLHDYKQYVLN